MNAWTRFITDLEYRILRVGGWKMQSSSEGPDDADMDNIRRLFPSTVWEKFTGKRVLDFGCGLGHDAVEIARHGAKFVVGVDIQESYLASARRLAEASGVSDRCCFSISTTEKFDVVMSINAFEHIGDPAAAFRSIRESLVPGGVALIAFGPLWYHPYGGHFFTLFPWAHLVFTEKSLLRWRADYIHDGATRYEDITGGLNRMTVRRFEKLVRSSGLTSQSFECVPIKAARLMHNRFTREFLTFIVRCELRRNDR
jgi:2-polyprenyl-3-methyl-5-hydroxy-6-metoxy-1,4-benzoquinol methylase